VGGKHHSRRNYFTARQAEIARSAREKAVKKAAEAEAVPAEAPKVNPYDRLRAKIDADRAQTTNNE
jgi:hypothetical protein